MVHDYTDFWPHQGQVSCDLMLKTYRWNGQGGDWHADEMTCWHIDMSRSGKHLWIAYKMQRGNQLLHSFQDRNNITMKMIIALALLLPAFAMAAPEVTLVGLFPFHRHSIKFLLLAGGTLGHEGWWWDGYLRASSMLCLWPMPGRYHFDIFPHLLSS